MPSSSHYPWICAQIGSREHYSIPRALHQQGRLCLFMTDFWAPQSRLAHRLPGSRRAKVMERSHPDLRDAPVISPGDRRLFFDFRQKLLGRKGWNETIRRNEWFQDQMLRRLQGPCRHHLKKTPPGTFFSYSYAARRLFTFFKAEGWRTVLGQIDPGPREEAIVARETERENDVTTTWVRAPEIYWDHWREECELADQIWVNSPWSSEALVAEGVPERKLHTVPLAYADSPCKAPGREKSHPARFSSERPLRVLFLGQINVRKGAHLLLRAARQLREEPIEFWMVGPTDLSVPEEFRTSSRFRWPGPVSRNETDVYYREADLFILPTLSDGFALTQLEAQARQLPLLVSRFCGQVVRDGENGLLLDPLDEATIAEKLRYCLRNPETVAAFSRNSTIAPAFRFPALSKFLDERSESFAKEIPSPIPSSA